MPSYKTHSIHGEVLLDNLDNRIEIDKESLKTYCIGFDSLMICDYDFFKKHHNYRTKEYFETVLKYIKDNHLQDNSEVMAYFYGQLDHFILDIAIHPLIYYMTSHKEKDYKLDYHALVEMWTDEYVMRKYNKTEKKYYHQRTIHDIELKRLMDYVYKRVYNKTRMVLKYDIGIISIAKFDELVRNNTLKIMPLIIKMINLGQIVYLDDLDQVLPYLNLEKDTWYNPETGEEYTKSFDDLWDESLETSREAIEDVNRFLYDDKPLKTRIITDNLSANTGLPNKIKQKIKYFKKY